MKRQQLQTKLSKKKIKYTSDDVAEVRDVVDVRQRAGYEDVAAAGDRELGCLLSRGICHGCLDLTERGRWIKEESQAVLSRCFLDRFVRIEWANGVVVLLVRKTLGRVGSSSPGRAGLMGLPKQSGRRNNSADVS